MKPPHRARLTLFALLLLAACGTPEAAVPAEWTLVEGGELSGPQAAQHARATQARDALFSRLVGELTDAMQAGGPAAAIPVCRDRAPKIAQEVSEEFGLTIGRTSDRLRNPGNQAPDWAREFIADGGASAEPRTLVRGEDELRALFPIRIAPACLQCHGPAEGLAAPVREALAENYPDDRATGYAEGELRGWFLVDVPTKKPG